MTRKTRAWTDRDDQMMRFLAQQWCADLSGVQLALDIGQRRAYELMKEWRDEFKMINCENIRPHGWPGESYTVLWLRPSKVEQFLGWRPTQPWKAQRDNIVHKIQVSRVRAALCGLDGDLWVPERQLWRAAMVADGVRPIVTPMRLGPAGQMIRSHRRLRPGHRPVHDGRCRIGDQWWSVEVELTLKKPVARLERAVLSAWNSRTEGDGLLYLYGTDRIGNALERTIDGLIEAEKLPRHPNIMLLELDTSIEQRSIQRPAADPARVANATAGPTGPAAS